MVNLQLDPKKQVAILAQKLAKAQEESAQWEAIAQAEAEKIGELIKQQSTNEKAEPSTQK